MSFNVRDITLLPVRRSFKSRRSIGSDRLGVRLAAEPKALGGPALPMALLRFTLVVRLRREPARSSQGGRIAVDKPIAIFAIVCGLLLPQQRVMAHAGGLGSQGCHREVRTDAYHCHSNSEEGTWKFMGGLATGVLILWLAAEWVDHVFMTAGPVRVAPYFDDELKAGVVAEYSLGKAQRIGARAVTRVQERREDVRLGVYWRLDF